MVKVNPINLADMSHSLIFSFFTRLVILIKRISANKLKIAAQVDAILIPALKKFEEAYKKKRKSEWTEIIKQLDKEIDNTISGMLSIITGMVKSSDVEMSQSAQRLKNLFSEFKGIPRNKGEEQNSANISLIQQLKGEYSEDITKLGLDKWVLELEEKSDKINAARDTRVSEKAEKSTQNSAVAKKEIIAIYRAICNQININVMTEGSENYEEFIRNLNALISEFESGNVSTSAGKQEDLSEPKLEQNLED
jgi:prophage DNA circulation protein